MRYGGKYSLVQLITEDDQDANKSTEKVSLNRVGDTKYTYTADKDWWEEGKADEKVKETEGQTAARQLVVDALKNGKSIVDNTSLDPAAVAALKSVTDAVDGEDGLSSKTKGIFYRKLVEKFDEIMGPNGIANAPTWTPATKTIEDWAKPFISIGQAREDEGSGGTQLGMGELALVLCFSNLQFNKDEDKSARVDLVANGNTALHVKASEKNFGSVTFYNAGIGSKQAKAVGLDKEETWVNTIEEKIGGSKDAAAVIGQICFSLWNSGDKKFNGSGLTAEVLSNQEGRLALSEFSPNERTDVWNAIFSLLDQFAYKFLDGREENFPVRDGNIVIVAKGESGGGLTTLNRDSGIHFKAQKGRDEVGVGKKKPTAPKAWIAAGTKEQVAADKKAAAIKIIKSLWSNVGNDYTYNSWKSDYDQGNKDKVAKEVSAWINSLYKAIDALDREEIRPRFIKLAIIKNILSWKEKGSPSIQPAAFRSAIMKKLELDEPNLQFSLLGEIKMLSLQNRLFEWAVK